MQKSFFVLIIIAALGVGIYFFINKNNPPLKKTMTSTASTSNTQALFDARNSTFTINNKPVTLVNGLSEESIPNSSSKITTRYFGNEAKGDLNGDGLEDQAFLVTQDTGGSGLFYYAVVSLKTPNGYRTTNAFFIGDRIAPQTLEIHPDSMELYVNYAERKLGEPMTASPSVGVTKLLKVSSDGVLEGLMK
jgi:hypothetical protein